MCDKAILGLSSLDRSNNFDSDACRPLRLFRAPYKRHFTPESLDDDCLSNSKLVLITNTSITGCGFIQSPLPLRYAVCHCCRVDVQIRFSCMSSSFSRSVTLSHSYNENLHNFNKRAEKWLQNPTWQATQEQEAFLTSPRKIHTATFKLWGGWFFLKLWWHWQRK